MSYGSWGGRRVAACASLLAIPFGVAAQAGTADSVLIREARIAQNTAIAADDFDRVASFWIDDVEVTAGLGFTVTGKVAYRAALAADSALTYERTPSSIDVSETWPLAFEQGTWEGWDAAHQSTIEGSYAAQWIRREDEWKIRSELFVATGCTGDACNWGVGVP